MATGKDYKPDPVKQERWRLARREDLANAMGIVLSVPFHGRNERGELEYGARPELGWANQEIEKEFEADMAVLIQSETAKLASAGLLTQDQVNAIRSHPYSVGPAAQEWPKVFFEFYQDAQPFLSNGADLLQWGAVIHSIITAIRSWARRKERMQSANPHLEEASFTGQVAMPDIVLTRPAIVALCYWDLFTRHSVEGSVEIQTLPRSQTEYATEDHPGGGETYLVQARCQGRSYYYYMSGSGFVHEHFVIDDDGIRLLELPEFVEGGGGPALRVPHPPQMFRVKGTPTSLLSRLRRRA